mmetsp:Transcript_26801/g.27157  ORF Transcript_26801/g.27157 Transcript_26801/m.27157 type:complete len:378 (-) Transcript_26801:45-1178(-)
MAIVPRLCTRFGLDLGATGLEVFSTAGLLRNENNPFGAGGGGGGGGGAGLLRKENNPFGAGAGAGGGGGSGLLRKENNPFDAGAGAGGGGGGAGFLKKENGSFLGACVGEGADAAFLVAAFFGADAGAFEGLEEDFTVSLVSELLKIEKKSNAGDSSLSLLFCDLLADLEKLTAFFFSCSSLTFFALNHSGITRTYRKLMRLKTNGVCAKEQLSSAERTNPFNDFFSFMKWTTITHTVFSSFFESSFFLILNSNCRINCFFCFCSLYFASFFFPSCCSFIQLSHSFFFSLGRKNYCFFTIKLYFWCSFCLCSCSIVHLCLFCGGFNLGCFGLFLSSLSRIYLSLFCGGFSLGCFGLFLSGLSRFGFSCIFALINYYR